MRNTIQLRNPVTINGKPVEALTYDTNEINAPLFAQAEALKKQAAGLKNVAIVPAVEFDFSLHLYLGFAAVIAVSPEMDFTDLERTHGYDLVKLMEIGRNFILRSEESQASSSGTASETTPEPSTPALPTSIDGQ